MTERELIVELRSALLWCSGSADFHINGIAYTGWQGVCAPAIEHTNEYLEDNSK